MLKVTTLLALFATDHLVMAQAGFQFSTCPSPVPYTATSIFRTFDQCVPAFAWGATFAPNPTPYPTNAAACVNLCTGSCVAANWAVGNNCQLALNSVLFLSSFGFWNPTWTAYVLRTTPPATSTTSIRPPILITPVVTTPAISSVVTPFLSPSPSPPQPTASMAACSPDANYFDYTNCLDGCQCISKFGAAGPAACLYSFDYSKPCTNDAQCLQYGSWYPYCFTANFTRTPLTGYCASNNATDFAGSRNVACARGRTGLLGLNPPISPWPPQVVSFLSLPTPSSAPTNPPSSVPSSIVSRPVTSSTTLSTPSVVPSASNLTCPGGNGTTYTNERGTQFSINCGFDLYDADPELRTVQPNFQSCIDDCDRRFAGKCPGVTWVSTDQWCYFKPDTASLQQAADTLWSAARLPGPEGLTCPEANGTVYTDSVYTDLLVDQYSIYCGFELVDPNNTTRSDQPSFEACINDCHEDDDCDGVTWRPNGEDQRWCYHKSRTAAVRKSGVNYWSALKIYNESRIGTGGAAVVSSQLPVSLGPSPLPASTLLSSPSRSSNLIIPTIILQQ